MINLKDIVLEQVEHGEFMRMAYQWPSMPRGYVPDKDYVQIVSPLRANTYADLLESFLESEYARRIAIRIFGGWKRYKVDKVRENCESEFIEKLESTSPDKRILEIDFVPVPQYPKSMINIYVRDMEKDVVSCTVNFPWNLWNYFSWKEMPKFTKQIVIGFLDKSRKPAGHF